MTTAYVVTMRVEVLTNHMYRRRTAITLSLIVVAPAMASVLFMAAVMCTGLMSVMS